MVLYLAGCLHPDYLVIPEWNNDSLVVLDAGAISGIEDKDGTWAWKGIPFAEPPVGELRWKAPRPVAPWSGIRKANRFGPKAVQVQSLFTRIITGSEDCLYLNVWRPQTEETGLPVYVWIHGGGNSLGSASLKDYWGHRFASRNNAVFVSLQYRLGPMGWLYHPALVTEDPLDSSGNYGLLDLIAGLQWIQNNIEAFGGDPGNVTISGESAGACNVLTLMNVPAASGLFHKAVMQSGYRRSVSKDEAEEQAGELVEYLAERKGLEADNLTPDEIRELLYSAPAKRIERFYTAHSTGMINHLYHIEDGAVFPETGYERFDQGYPANPVPLILGTNHDESKMFLFFNDSSSFRESRYQTASRYGSLSFKIMGADSVAAAIRLNPENPPVYMYRFDWGTPFPDGSSVLPGEMGLKLGAYHTAEIPIFLGTDTCNGVIFTKMVYSPENEHSRKLLTEEVQSYLYSFIRTGDPNRLREDHFDWPQWDSSHTYITFNADFEKVLLGTEDAFLSKPELWEQVEAIEDSEVRDYVWEYIYER